MKQRKFTVIDATRDVHALSRAGRKAGVSSVAKLGGVTMPRAKRVLRSAVANGLLQTYSHSYRSNIVRCCYSPTQAGLAVLNVLASHEKSYRMIGDGNGN